jgi:hypothetical protein
VEAEEMTPLIAALAPVLGTLVDRLVPDAHEATKAKAELEAKLIEASLAANQAQTDINAKEAEHRSLWVSGWRPGVGWACAAGFAWTYIGHPIATWSLTVAGVETTLPPIDTAPLTEMLLAMLGMAGLRSFEKMKGLTR